MLLAKVVGRATATVKHASLAGWKLLLVQPLAADGRSADGNPFLAIDDCGAGVGASVIITSDGKAAKKLVGCDKTPIRWSVAGICDK
jgi:ethanolamine utilization protein EutN